MQNMHSRHKMYEKFIDAGEDFSKIKEAQLLEVTLKVRVKDPSIPCIHFRCSCDCI